ncbi:MAG TPA: preprotein translocase subunit SecY [Firmicutes bacterium]|nr:preprotein translocase subunit SecY [Bacillota bacterium]
MLETLARAVRVKDIRQRLAFTAFMIFLFRLGAHVPVPGINTDVIAQLFREGTIFALIDLFSGGAFKTFSIFAMTIYPYINASIIVQLLTVVIPSWEEMAKEEDGRKKLAQYTRYGAVILGLVQGTGMAFAMKHQGALINPGFMSMATVVVTLTAGTAFLMWLGELTTEKGIGNGISIIVFAGIVSRYPGDIANMIALYRAGRIGIWNVAVFAAMALVILAGIIFITEGERRIPVQYAKRVVGRKVYGGQSTHIPMKINQAGVIPVIFAQSVLAFPPTIASFINAPWARTLEAVFDYRKPGYMLAYALLILFFTYFYTAITFNPAEVANNMKKYGGFIPGIRPGRPTAEFLTRILGRITLVGAIFLAVVATLPNVVMKLTNIPGISLGGTALLIVIGVTIETMKQLEAHLIMRQYQGFLK